MFLTKVPLKGKSHFLIVKCQLLILKCQFLIVKPLSIHKLFHFVPSKSPERCRWPRRRGGNQWMVVLNCGKNRF